MEFEPVIGLEVHLQLATQTKMFCSCQVQFAASANSLTCPVCLGLPGSLPVINSRAIEYALKVALALNCSIGEIVKFDRKNYYYPDLPKNYQISQYDLPLSFNGFVDIKDKMQEKKIRIRRVHLEEDAGKLIHEEAASLVDYNRTGVALLEIVTEPDICSPLEAYNYLNVLKTTLKYLNVSDCDMEKGSLRCDANISLRPRGIQTLGVKAELKNMNSFRAVKAALEAEIVRQTEILKSGKAVVQETRLWDEDKKATFSMRSKEEASDYRYFPEPDLVPFKIEKAKIEEVRANLPELPAEKLERFKSKFGLSGDDAQFLVMDYDISVFFEECAKILPNSRAIANWVKGPLSFEINTRNKSLAELELSPKDFVSLIKLTEESVLSNLSAKAVLTQMLDKRTAPQEIIKAGNFAQVSDDASLNKLIEESLIENKNSVDSFLAGKENALMFLVGQVMKKSKGKANPKRVKELLEEKLKEKKNA